MVQATFNESLPGAKAGQTPQEAAQAEQERQQINEQLKAQGKPQIPKTSLQSGTASKKPEGSSILAFPPLKLCSLQFLPPSACSLGRRHQADLLHANCRWSIVSLIPDYERDGGPGTQGPAPVQNPLV